jgi:hypothetical protein
MIKKKVIFVHGYGEYVEDFWPNWLEREFVKYGFDFLYLKMPDPMYPQIDQWLTHLENQKIEIDEQLQEYYSINQIFYNRIESIDNQKSNKFVKIDDKVIEEIKQKKCSC